MKNFIFILLFNFVSLFAQRADQNQQQRADNGKPYTVAIHKLNNKALNDSLLMETEDTTNFFSRRTSVGDLKNYINSQGAQKVFNLTADLTDTANVIISANTQYYDLDGDSMFYTCVKVNATFSLRFWKDAAHTQGANLDTGGNLIFQNVNSSLFPEPANAGYWGISSYFTTTFHSYPEIFFQFYNSINQIGGTTLGMAQPTGGAQFQLILSL